MRTSRLDFGHKRKSQTKIKRSVFVRLARVGELRLRISI
jgi:hypothetical protein